MFVRPCDISKATGGLLSRSRAYDLEKSDLNFPKRIRLSPRSTGWDQEELYRYIQGFKEEDRLDEVNKITKGS